MHSGGSILIAAPTDSPDEHHTAASQELFGDVVGTLRRRGRAPMLVEGDRCHSWAQIADAVEARSLALGGGRRLVAVEAANTVDFVVTYLAAWHRGHAVLVTSAHHDELVGRYRPDTVVRARSPEARPAIDQRSPRPDHQLHDDLALLLSTSGSTGSPKLVRLAHRAVAANAAAIASYQRLTSADVGITSLPLSYCYGLSVLHAHLVAGAPIVVTDAPVTDDRFWDSARRHGVTNLAGVPHTFDLIDRLGAERLRLPTLRLVTQAGGRMAPHRVRALAQQGAADGFDLMVMYGQTEATARMAYLPPALAHTHPDRVGVAVPGGRFEIQPVPGGLPPDMPPGTGRVVFHGPNVMMGYADDPADLRRGAEVSQLVTGDLGRIDDHGLLQIVGREHRFAKIFGHRIDLQRVEETLAGHGLSAACTSDDERLVVACEGDSAPARELIASTTGLPGHVVSVVAVDVIPRLTSGKPDLDAVASLATRPAPPSSVAEAFAAVFGSPPAPTDTFVRLNGTSLNYVTLSMRLEEVLGRLPDDWHERTVDELQRSAVGHRGRLARVETSVVLRAVAICLVVGSHIGTFDLEAGAHVLLAVSGYNVARFQLQHTSAADWRAKLARPFVRLAAVTSAWIATFMVAFGHYGIESLLLVNNYLGEPERTNFRWRYWYLEVLVQLGVLLVVVFAWSPVRRLERRWPLAFVGVLLIPALALRFEWLVIGGTRNDIFRTDTVLWLFLLGWAIQRAETLPARAAVIALIVATVPGYFVDDDRSLRLMVGLVLLTAVRQIPVPRPLHRLVGWLASASLVIYLTHYPMIRPLREHLSREATFIIIVGAGLLCWAVLERVAPRIRRSLRRTRPAADG